MEAMVFILGLLAPLAVSLWLRPRSVRKRRQQADATYRELEQWAADKEWRVVEGIDLHFAEIADRITGLVGVPRDWAFHYGERDPTRDDPTMAGSSQKWIYGPILVRQVATGELVIVDSWPDGDGSHHVFASMDTDGVFSPYTLDLLISNDQRIYVQGKQPLASEILDLPQLLDGLPRPVRLRMVNRQILLYARGALSTALAEGIADRLQRLHEHLPGRPDLGPMR
jgi:hypothetical protein